MSTKTPQKKSAFAASPVNSSKETSHPFTPSSKRAPAIPAKLTGEEQLTSFATRLPPDFIKRFKTTCIEREVTMQEAVYTALREWIEQDR